MLQHEESLLHKIYKARYFPQSSFFDSHELCLSASPKASGAKGETSSHHELHIVWKHLWKMKLPHKICIFAWRACKDGLTCLHNLHKWRVEIDGFCLFCGNQEEDIAHALFYCIELSDWWQWFLPQMHHAPANLIFLELVKWFMDYGGLMESTTCLYWLN